MRAAPISTTAMTSTDATPPGPEGAPVPPNPQGAADALLVAAAELFSTRSPSMIKLRDIAEAAGVNYGLIHRHFGTRDDLLRELFRSLTGHGRVHVERSADVEEATQRLFDSNPPGLAEVFALVALDGADPSSVFDDPRTVEAFVGLLQRRWEGSGTTTAEPFDPRLVAGFVMVNIMLWDLVAPYAQAFSGLQDQTLAQMRVEVLRLLQTVLARLAPATSPGDAGP